MRSPFPGMDPFLESDEWTDFHVSFLVELGRILVPQVRPKYIVRRERRVYVEHEVAARPHKSRVPDVAVVVADTRAMSTRSTAVTTSETISPVTLTLPMPETHRETFLTIRDSTNREVVCVIEVLSPSNKRTGSNGRSEYLGKRNEVFGTQSNMVELDLLRGGNRLSTVEPLPGGDYYCFVSRTEERPAVSVYAWRLRNRLPEIPIPLANGDADVWIDLQQAFDTVYDDSGYDYSLNYQAALDPAVSDEDAEWIQNLLSSRSSAESDESGHP